MEVPLLLLWGDKDPWIGPRMADRMQSLYPSATKVTLDAGHCPHDEVGGPTSHRLMTNRKAVAGERGPDARGGGTVHVCLGAGGREP
jgi:pimeloyl-ACP methyl ester carboxylesterase